VVWERWGVCYKINTIKTTMDDELIQVKAKIVETEGELAIAKTDKDRELVLSLTNLLVRLYEKEARIEARVEARLSAGEIYCNRGVCDLVLFLSI
jgi:hypothetical protein